MIQGTAQDFAAASSLARVVKADNSTLAAAGLVDESKATVDYLDLSQADRLADEVAKAYDPVQLNRVLARLPYNDPNALEFVTEFYNKLGAQNILNLAGRLHGDETGLRVLDESFASATNSPTFNPQIIPDLGQSIAASDASDEREAFENLLHYGVYSTDFLSMTAYENWYKWLNPPDPVVFEALSRNPAAASFILNIPHTFPDAYGNTVTVVPLDRLFLDLQNNHDLDDSSLDGPAAQLLKSATSGDAVTAAANRSHLTWQMSQGNIDDIPDSVRKAIADMAAEHYDEIGKRPDAVEFYKHLTEGHEDIAQELARAALQQHAAATFPHMRPGESEQQFINDLRAWAQNEGTYSPALFEALRANGMEEAESKARDWEWKWFVGETLFTSALLAVPGAGEEQAAATVSARIVAWGKEAGTDGSEGAFLKYIEDKVKPDFTGTALEHVDATEREIKGQQIKQLTTLPYVHGQIGTGHGMPPDQYLDQVVRTYVNGYKPGQADDALWYFRHKLDMSEGQIDALQGALDGFISHEDPSMYDEGN